MLMRQGKFNIALFIGSVFLFSICVWSFLYFVRKYRKEENQENNPPFSIIFCFVFFIYNIIFFFFVIQYSFQTVAWLTDPEAYDCNEYTDLLLRFTKKGLTLMELLYVLLVIVILALLFYVYKIEEDNIKLRSEMQELRSIKTRKDMLVRVTKKDQYKNR